MKPNRRGTWAVNCILVLMIAVLYAITSADTAAASAYPCYCGRSQTHAALEFAVSWNAAHLGDILDTLKEKHTHATFFVSGEWVESNPSLACRMADEGHEIGTLGYEQGFTGTLEELQADIIRGIDAIERHTGVKARLYHSGKRDVKASAEACRALSLIHVMETVNLRCGSGNAEDIITRGLNEPILGGIILLQPTRECAAALGTLIDKLSARGITAARVSDVL